MPISKEFNDALSQVTVENGTGVIVSNQKVHRVKPDEALKLIGSENLLGDVPRLNIRTRDIELNGEVITQDDLSRLYLLLCKPNQTWSKELVVDTVNILADSNSYDPVSVYLNNLGNIAPLHDDYWNNLDQFLFNIDDPVAKKFMPRYLTMAVKRVLEPACMYRQIPVLIGPQLRGKSELGRALFGSYYGSGLKGTFCIDDVGKLERVWVMELAELDGITKKAQVEAFKDFVSRREDIDRRKYGRGVVAIPRRSIFWGTSNQPPLNDASGSTRFVCIPVQDVRPAIDRVLDLRDSIWQRAYLEYRNNYQCWSTEEEQNEINKRNSDFEFVDPWTETLEDLIDATRGDFINTVRIHEELELEPKHLKNSDSTRIRKIMGQLGWTYGRLRFDDNKQKRGFRRM
jgi:predicted P-loop ATPase